LYQLGRGVCLARPEGSVATVSIVVGEDGRELTASARQTHGDRGGLCRGEVSVEVGSCDPDWRIVCSREWHGHALPHRPQHQISGLKPGQISFAKPNQRA